jgi:hypothetical protein
VLTKTPRTVYSLLRHEGKVTTLNVSVTPVAGEEEEGVVVKSKDCVVVQCAGRRYEIRPVFSQPLPTASENGVRKFERYLQPGRTSVASWIGKTVIGKDVPVLFFKKTGDGTTPDLFVDNFLAVLFLYCGADGRGFTTCCDGVVDGAYAAYYCQTGDFDGSSVSGA